MKIHPTAVISPDALLEEGVEKEAVRLEERGDRDAERRSRDDEPERRRAARGGESTGEEDP